MPPHSWSGWIERYSAAGHTVHAPAWPGVSELDEELDHSKAPADIRLGEVVDHYAAFVRALPDPPILMGHSFGGLITQMLLDKRAGPRRRCHPPRRAARRLSAAAFGAAGDVPGVAQAVESASCRAAHPCRVPLRVRQYGFAGGIRLLARQTGDSRAGPAAVPIRGGQLPPKSRAATFVDYAKSDRAPLLLIAGGRDHITPSSVVYENFNRYRRSAAATDFKLFEDRPHLTAALDGWSDVADYALTWTAGRSG